MEELYKTLGYAKCVELSKKSRKFWDMLKLAESRKNAPVGGLVRECIAKDFIRELLPQGLGLKSGLIFKAENKTISPQCDAIVYSGVPLLEFTDTAVVEMEQVKAVFEIKAWIDQGTIFGRKIRGTGDREPESGLRSTFERRKKFLPAQAKYILFAFSLSSSSSDADVVKRLKKICDYHAVVLRWYPKSEQKKGSEPAIYNFDNSVSRLIKWLRNLN
jgi:hypothetical protein